jgi:hypothetical protein
VPTLRPRHGPKAVFSCRAGTMARLAHRAGVGPSGSVGPSTWRRAAGGLGWRPPASADQRRSRRAPWCSSWSSRAAAKLEAERRRDGEGVAAGSGNERRRMGAAASRETMGEERGRRRDRDLRSMRLLAVQLPIQGATEAGGGAGRGGWGMGQR